MLLAIPPPPTAAAAAAAVGEQLSDKLAGHTLLLQHLSDASAFPHLHPTVLRCATVGRAALLPCVWTGRRGSLVLPARAPPPPPIISAAPCCCRCLFEDGQRLGALLEIRELESKLEEQQQQRGAPGARVTGWGGEGWGENVAALQAELRPASHPSCLLLLRCRLLNLRRPPA